MKQLYLIGGAMGAGKSAVGRELNRLADKSVWLDGDDLWRMNPFTVSENTKLMVMANIRAVINNFLACPDIDCVIFTWVMHEQEIIDDILSGLALDGVEVRAVSLILSEESLKSRLEKDIAAGIRQPDIVERSLGYLKKYDTLDTEKLDVSGISPEDAAKRILEL